MTSSSGSANYNKAAGCLFEICKGHDWHTILNIWSSVGWLLCGACLVLQARLTNPRWARPGSYKARESTKAEHTGQYLTFIMNGTLIQNIVSWRYPWQLAGSTSVCTRPCFFALGTRLVWILLLWWNTGVNAPLMDEQVNCYDPDAPLFPSLWFSNTRFSILTPSWSTVTEASSLVAPHLVPSTDSSS